MNSMNRIEGWKAQMLVDGITALLALLNGSASLGHLAAAEPYDVVDDVLGTTDVEAGVLGAFDQGCLSLAQEYRDHFLRDERAGNPADLLKETLINLSGTKNVSINGIGILMYSWRKATSLNGRVRRLGG